MPVSESVKKAQQKYYENIKRININSSNEIYELFANYCKDTKQTKKEVFEKALQFYIDYPFIFTKTMHHFSWFQTHLQI